METYQYRALNDACLQVCCSPGNRTIGRPQNIFYIPNGPLAYLAKGLPWQSPDDQVMTYNKGFAPEGFR